MQPEGIVRCVASYTGENHKGQPLKLEEGKQYFKAEANGLVFLNDYDQPTRQLPWLTPEDFAKLQGTYLK